MISTIKDILTFIRWFGRFPVFPALTMESLEDYIEGNNGGDLDILIFLAERTLRDPTDKKKRLYIDSYNDGLNNVNLLNDSAIGEKDNMSSLRIRPNNVLKMCRDINLSIARAKKRKIGGYKIAYARKIERGIEIIKWAIKERQKTQRGFDVPKHNPQQQPEMYQKQSDIFANSMLETISELKAKIIDFGLKMYVDHRIWPIKPKRIPASSELPEHRKLINSFKNTVAQVANNGYHYYAHSGVSRVNFTAETVFGLEPMITSLNLASPGYISGQDGEDTLKTICDFCINDPIALLNGYGEVQQSFDVPDIMALKWFYNKLLDPRATANSTRAVNLGLLTPETTRESVSEVTPLLAGLTTSPLFQERESDFDDVIDTEIWQVQFWDGLMRLDEPTPTDTARNRYVTNQEFWNNVWLPRVIEEQSRLGIIATMGKAITDTLREAIHLFIYSLIQGRGALRVVTTKIGTYIITPMGRFILSNSRRLTQDAIRALEAASRATVTYIRDFDKYVDPGNMRTLVKMGRALQCTQCKQMTNKGPMQTTFFNEDDMPSKLSLTDAWQFNPMRFKGTAAEKLRRHWIQVHKIIPWRADELVAQEEARRVQRAREWNRMSTSFGKIIKPYKPYLYKIDKGIWLKTQFGIKKVQDNKKGLFIQGPGRKFYLYKWHRK